MNEPHKVIAKSDTYDLNHVLNNMDLFFTDYEQLDMLAEYALRPHIVDKDERIAEYIFNYYNNDGRFLSSEYTAKVYTRASKTNKTPKALKGFIIRRHLCNKAFTNYAFLVKRNLNEMGMKEYTYKDTSSFAERIDKETWETIVEGYLYKAGSKLYDTTDLIGGLNKLKTDTERDMGFDIKDLERLKSKINILHEAIEIRKESLKKHEKVLSCIEKLKELKPS